MTGDVKQKTLILFGLVLIITMIIAASLPRLEFKAGLPLPELKNNQVVATDWTVYGVILGKRGRNNPHQNRVSPKTGFRRS